MFESSDVGQTLAVEKCYCERIWIMSFFDKVKEITNINVPDKLLVALVFEMSRSADKEFINEIQKIQKTKSVVIDTPTRKQLRKKFYYGEYYTVKVPFQIKTYTYLPKDIENVFEDCYLRLNNYDPGKIVESLKTRFDELQNQVDCDNHMNEWLRLYNERRNKNLYSFVAFRLDQKLFKESGYNENILTDFISKTYCELDNYRNMALIIQGEIYNKENACITWNLLYKAGIFAENFIQYKDDFHPFNKEKQIKKLVAFLNERNVKEASCMAENFYSSISTGYKYEDCYISDNQDCKILIYKKIELDNTRVPCPSCNTTIQSGNSYPEMFLRSWECKNPSCPERSKSGRGKRFDEYGVYRYFKLVENDPENRINTDLYQSFRRDVFDHRNNWYDFLIKEYSYSNEKIYMKNCSIDNAFGRIVINPDFRNMVSPKNSVECYSKLPIVVLFKCILENAKFTTGNIVLKNELEIVNDNSTLYLQKIKEGQIGTAITSPPYYNAREYSQWETMIMYFVDMLFNCKVIFDTLAFGSYYLYNIGDIVSEDNIYVASNMSKHRVQLGFLSSMIFELAGYNLTGNIIWDKGEIQSKRSSTVNLFPGYVRCINCYEHVLVFRKGKYERFSNSVEQITPVIKINCKGENTYKHTAPYPIELVELIRPYVNKDLYVLDPFLGSGTTLKWCKNNGIKGVGTELNSEYFELCKENIMGVNEQMSLFDNT